MNYTHMMQDALDYIEQNLKTELSAEELAMKAGFSLFHFYRLFLRYTGMPIVQYIVRRRLVHAIYEIKSGKKQIEAALDYGFDTNAGFYKAFVREFDVSPTEYMRRFPVKQPHRIILRQEAYIMITHAKLKEILENWDIPKPVIITDMLVGGANEVQCDDAWYVGDTLVITARSCVPGSKLLQEVNHALQLIGFTSNKPIQTKDGKEYVSDNGIFYCLYNRNEGESLKSSEIFIGDYKSNARYLGEVIAQLHKVLNKCSDTIQCGDNNLYDSIITWAMPKTREYLNEIALPLPECFYDDYINNFKHMQDQLPKQYIHKELHPGNLLVKDSKPVGFVDFTVRERNVKLYDPCYCATGILSECFAENNPDKLSKWLEIRKSIMNGYDSVCPLSEVEWKAIPYVIYSIQMICIAWGADTKKYPNITEVNCRMLLWLYENRDKLV